VEADETGNGWVAYQRMPMKRATNGNLIVSAGGGGIGMHIDRCSGAISDVYYQR
jgi:hypothetical protein